MISLKSAIDDFNAVKATQMPQEVLDIMARTTAELEASGIENQALGVGDQVPDSTLPNQNAEPRRFADFLRDGPVVLNIYRGGWCPYCNLEMKALADTLPEIKAAGATLVGMAPEDPDHVMDTVTKNELPIEILSDVGNSVSEQLGLVFTLAEELRPIYKGAGIDIPAFNGDETFRLPMPATYIIGSDGKITSAFVKADYTQRLEPSEILAALK